MPEVISKYPDVTLKILKEAGAVCGEGAEQRILTKCPPAQFCALPTGEVCVYGVDGIPRMTQITYQEIVRQASGKEGVARQDSITLSAPLVILLGTTFLVGVVAGRVWGRRGSARQERDGQP